VRERHDHVLTPLAESEIVAAAKEVSMMRRYGFRSGVIMAVFGLGWLAGHLPNVSAQGSQRVVEFRTYTAAEGKLDAMAKRFAEERKFFEKHGMKSILYSVAVEPAESTNDFVYVLSHESREAAKKSWEGVLADPGFKELISKTGRMSVKQGIVFAKPTDYSPVK
jgi:NIPSNAP protein